MRDLDSEEGQSHDPEANGEVLPGDSGPGLLIRAIWFILIGWWVTGIWLGIAWILNLTIIGIPLGLKMINRVPEVLTLKQRAIETRLQPASNGEIAIMRSNRPQAGLVLRAAWFMFIGWWASGIWTVSAWFVSLTIIGLPISIWMIHKLPFVVSLYRY